MQQFEQLLAQRPFGLDQGRLGSMQTGPRQGRFGHHPAAAAERDFQGQLRFQVIVETALAIIIAGRQQSGEHWAATAARRRQPLLAGGHLGAQGQQAGVAFQGGRLDLGKLRQRAAIAGELRPYQHRRQLAGPVQRQRKPGATVALFRLGTVTVEAHPLVGTFQCQQLHIPHLPQLVAVTGPIRAHIGDGHGLVLHLELQIGELYFQEARHHLQPALQPDGFQVPGLPGAGGLGRRHLGTGLAEVIETATQLQPYIGIIAGIPELPTQGRGFHGAGTGAQGEFRTVAGLGQLTFGRGGLLPGLGQQHLGVQCLAVGQGGLQGQGFRQGQGLCQRGGQPQHHGNRQPARQREAAPAHGRAGCPRSRL